MKYDDSGEKEALEKMEMGITISEYMNLGLSLDEAHEKWYKYKHKKD